MSMKIMREVVEHVRRSVMEWNGAEMFLVDNEISSRALVELVETARAIHNHAGFKLPYEIVVVGIPISTAFFVFFAEQAAGEIRFTWTARFEATPGSGFFRYHPATKKYKMARVLMPVNAVCQYSSEGGKPEHFDAEYMGTILIGALSLLCVRGVEKERIEPTEAQQKARLRRRKEPLDAVTVIRIQEHMKGDERGPMGERMAVRLHLRRGHYRGQHYGPGNSKIKDIFIEPCLVGYEEQGTITHDHYEIDEAVQVKQPSLKALTGEGIE